MRITWSLVVLAVFISSHAAAGSGFYYGAGAVSRAIDHRAVVTLVPGSPTSSYSRLTDRSTDVSVVLGYQAKRRLNDRSYLAPELQLSRFDGGLFYSTALAFGVDYRRLSPRASFGISHINRLDANSAFVELGINWRHSDTVAITLRWQRWQTFEESTESTTSFGAQTVTTTTDIRRNISQWMLGLQFFLHE